MGKYLVNTKTRNKVRRVGSVHLCKTCGAYTNLVEVSEIVGTYTWASWPAGPSYRYEDKVIERSRRIICSQDSRDWHERMRVKISSLKRPADEHAEKIISEIVQVRKKHIHEIKNNIKDLKIVCARVTDLTRFVKKPRRPLSGARHLDFLRRNAK